MPVGALLGGLLARVELRLPYLAGAAAFAVVTVVTARVVTEPAISAARAAADPQPAGGASSDWSIT